MSTLKSVLPWIGVVLLLSVFPAYVLMKGGSLTMALSFFVGFPALIIGAGLIGELILRLLRGPSRNQG